MADIKLDSEQLTAILHKAILDALGDTGQKALIETVVKYLTTPDTQYNRYGGTDKTPLLRALNEAAAAAAQKYFHERIANDPEFQKVIQELYVDAFKKFNTPEHRKTLIDKMANRLSEAFTKEY